MGPIFNRQEHRTPDPSGDRPSTDFPEEARPARSGSELKRVVDTAAERVGEIVDGAERVASEIIAEAEVEAERYLDGRRQQVEQVIDEWSADLRGRAELLSRQEGRLKALTETMFSELEEIATALRGLPPETDRSRDLLPKSKSSSQAASTESAPKETKPASGPPAAPATDEGLTKAGPAGRARSGGHENALLRAAQMAVAGGSREEIERALEEELAIPDPGPIVDELLRAERLSRAERPRLPIWDRATCRSPARRSPRGRAGRRRRSARPPSTAGGRR